jgi:hypothetical protein
MQAQSSSASSESSLARGSRSPCTVIRTSRMTIATTEGETTGAPLSPYLVTNDSDCHDPIAASSIIRDRTPQ